MSIEPTPSEFLPTSGQSGRTRVPVIAGKQPKIGTQTEVRTSGDVMVHWLPASAVIAAMAAAFEAARAEAEAAEQAVQENAAEGAPVAVEADGNDVAPAASDADGQTEQLGQTAQTVAETAEGAAAEVGGEATNTTFISDVGAEPLAMLAMMVAQGMVLPAEVTEELAAGRTILGTSGDDFLIGGYGDVLLGGAGNDTLVALSTLLGGVDGGDGYDQLIFRTDVGMAGNFAGRNIEKVVGSDHGDELSFAGKDSDVTLDGGGGDDVLIGGAGDDVLTGGVGIDALFGLAGNDTFYFDTFDSNIDGGDGIDTAIFVDAGGVIFDLGASSIEIAFGGAGNDVLSAIGYDAISQMFGGEGADMIYGGLLDDRMNGGADDDVLAGYNGNDALDGGSGYDVAMYSGARARYDVTRGDDGRVTVSDTLGVEGIDTLSGIEQLHFSDGDVVI